MKKNFRFAFNCSMSICLVGLCVVMFASSAYADGTFLSTETSIGDGYHKSSGSNSNGTTSRHDTTEWQELGYNTGGINNYGVSWSTDGGTNWGHDDLYVGQTVTFSFNMHSENVGNHYANLLKGWIDWSTDANSYAFDDNNDVVSGLKVLRYSKGASVSSDYTFDSGRGDSDYRNDYGYGNDNENYEYTLTLTEAHLGTAYLRARVTCSHSIVQEEWGTNRFDDWDEQWWTSWHTEAAYLAAFDAYSKYGQGEIEDWKINVLKSSSSNTPTPEPATLVLFGMGLIGVARVSRKKV